MAAKAEALAKQFEAKVQEATAVLERLSDADWKKTTASEKWTVGVLGAVIGVQWSLSLSSAAVVLVALGLLVVDRRARPRPGLSA